MENNEKRASYKFDSEENLARFDQSYINSLRLFLENDTYKNKISKVPIMTCQMIVKNEKRQGKEPFGATTAKKVRSNTSNQRYSK